MTNDDADNTHARNTLAMLRQADAEGIDVSDRIAELEAECDEE